MEVEYTRIDELGEYQPEIADKLKAATPNERGVREWQDENYAYGLWPSGYVRRRYIEIWKHQGWRAIPMEKHNLRDDLQTKIPSFSTQTFKGDSTNKQQEKSAALQGENDTP